MAEALTNFFKSMDSSSNHWKNHSMILELCSQVSYKNEEYVENLEQYVEENLKSSTGQDFSKLLLLLSTHKQISFSLQKIDKN